MKNMSQNRNNKNQGRLVAKSLFISAVFLTFGVAVAYYNTASFGYDNANLFSYDNIGIYVFDISIKFENIFKIIEMLKDFAPDNFITI